MSISKECLAYEKFAASHWGDSPFPMTKTKLIRYIKFRARSSTFVSFMTNLEQHPLHGPKWLRQMDSETEIINLMKRSLDMWPRQAKECKERLVGIGYIYENDSFAPEWKRQMQFKKKQEQFLNTCVRTVEGKKSKGFMVTEQNNTPLSSLVAQASSSSSMPIDLDLEDDLMGYPSPRLSLSAMTPASLSPSSSPTLRPLLTNKGKEKEKKSTSDDERIRAIVQQQLQEEVRKIKAALGIVVEEKEGKKKKNTETGKTKKQTEEMAKNSKKKNVSKPKKQNAEVIKKNANQPSKPNEKKKKKKKETNTTSQPPSAVAMLKEEEEDVVYDYDDVYGYDYDYDPMEGVDMMPSPQSDAYHHSQPHDLFEPSTPTFEQKTHMPQLSIIPPCNLPSPSTPLPPTPPAEFRDANKATLPAPSRSALSRISQPTIVIDGRALRREAKLLASLREEEKELSLQATLDLDVKIKEKPSPVKREVTLEDYFPPKKQKIDRMQIVQVTIEKPSS